MAPRSEVGWRGSGELKGSGLRSVEYPDSPQPATAARASAAVCQPDRGLYRAHKPRPRPGGIGQFKRASSLLLASWSAKHPAASRRAEAAPAQPKPTLFLVREGLGKFPLPHPQISEMIGQRTNLPRARYKLCSLSLKKVTLIEGKARSGRVGIRKPRARLSLPFIYLPYLWRVARAYSSRDENYCYKLTFIEYLLCPVWKPDGPKAGALWISNRKHTKVIPSKRTGNPLPFNVTT